ncbi:hypothetical protein UFOVP670_11 [uncultured Caudovirales phage]|uniref:Uncharacterized protein n=1 Tax=uncultured Caudovirales phage TaxID=2100421 RepID=A0A6J5N8Z9_9CAUD|nr:hypothetical protein UFOVP670_11 [uncultured Caudovirales phage]
MTEREIKKLGEVLDKRYAFALRDLASDPSKVSFEYKLSAHYHAWHFIKSPPGWAVNNDPWKLTKNGKRLMRALEGKP